MIVYQKGRLVSTWDVSPLPVLVVSEGVDCGIPMLQMMSQGRSTRCIGDGHPTFNRESLQWVYKPLLLG